MAKLGRVARQRSAERQRDVNRARHRSLARNARVPRQGVGGRCASEKAIGDVGATWQGKEADGLTLENALARIEEKVSLTVRARAVGASVGTDDVMAHPARRTKPRKIRSPNIASFDAGARRVETRKANVLCGISLKGSLALATLALASHFSRSSRPPSERS
jgi:hypothetical protein